MQELTPQDFENSFSDDADLAAVDCYLAATDERELRRVAAVLHSRPGGSAPEEALQDAEDLLLGSVGAASRRRQKLLLSMNRNTLQELTKRLFDPDEIIEYAYVSGRQSSLEDLEKTDPIRAPVFAMIKNRGLLPSPPDLITSEKMAAASKDTKVPYPGLPCDLEAALRWAADAPDVPFKTLDSAFFDWTTTIIESIRTRKKTLESYRSSFRPGKSRPTKNLAAQTKALITSRFGSSQRVALASDLLFFAADFRTFWKKHAAAYLKRAKIKSTKNKASGAGGPISGMRPVWKRRTDDFVRFAEGRQIPDTGSDEWNELFDEFAKSQPGEPRTQKKSAAFVSTLLVRAAAPISDDEIDNIIKLLKTEDVKSVDSETIRSCLEKLGAIAAS